MQSEALRVLYIFVESSFIVTLVLHRYPVAAAAAAATNFRDLRVCSCLNTPELIVRMSRLEMYQKDERKSFLA